MYYCQECGSPVYKVCGKVIPLKSGNTSNLLTHLRDHHTDKYSFETCPTDAKKCGMSNKGKKILAYFT